MEDQREKGGQLPDEKPPRSGVQDTTAPKAPLFDLDALAAGRFSWSAALALGVASKLCYEAESVVRSIVRSGWGLHEPTIFDEDDTQGFLARNGKVGVLAFRGTESLGDWLGNFRFQFRTAPFAPGRVHGGFLEAYLTVRDCLWDALREPPERLWITGHSLGGALAALAAADLRVDVLTSPPQVMTFGQPSVGDVEFGQSVLAAVAEEFYRFVNDVDLVTRLPPGWPHFGRLLHFDGQGNVVGSGASESIGDPAPPEMTVEEFHEMQEEVREVLRAAPAGGMSAEANERVEASIEGIIPGVSDHQIDRYISAIRLQLPRTDPVPDAAGDVTSFVLGPETTGDLTRGDSVGFILRGTQGETETGLGGRAVKVDPDVPVLIRLADPGWNPPTGVALGARFGNIVSARVPSSMIEAVAADPGVTGLEVSRGGGTESRVEGTLETDGGQHVRRPDVSERGDAAIFGMIDTGIDILHKAFEDGNGKTRILAVWDQTAEGGPTPADWGLEPNYGVVYSRADLEEIRASPEPVPRALRDWPPPRGHGTHVAGIGAGREVADHPAGMAPDAGIVVVIPDLQHSPIGPPSIGYSVSHVDALHFIIAVAGGRTPALSERRPVVVNVSQGMNAGSHDGMSLLERAFDSATGKGGDPGVVIVKSAGNERGFGGHARTRVVTSGQVEVVWDSEGFRFRDYFEAWYDGVDDLEFRLRDPAGNESEPVSLRSPHVTADLGGNRCVLEIRELHPDNGDNRLTFTIEATRAAIHGGRWTLLVRGVDVGSREGHVDVWVERDSNRWVRFRPEDPRITLSVPGTADSVITVGACSFDDGVAVAPWSSYGWTRKGGAKPNLCAPGVGVRSVAAGGAGHDEFRDDSGTSMAAPQVAGALALVLSARHKQPGRPQYNAQQLATALRRTAHFRSHIHHEGSGWGVLDARALFDALAS